MKKPCQFALLIPSDSDETEEYKTAAMDEVGRWIGLVQDWFIDQLGMTFDSELKRCDTELTVSAMNSGYPLDKCGDAGGTIGTFYTAYRAIYAKLGWDGGRQGCVLIDGGGFAGAMYWPRQKGTPDGGKFVLGDWELYKGVTGQPHPCNPWPELIPGRSFGHEFLHTMGADDQGMAYFTGDPIDDATRASIKTRSKAFLYRP